MRVTVVFFTGEVTNWEDVIALTVKEGRLEGTKSNGVVSSVALHTVCSWWAGT